ncbi:DUF202 domain-containing protein [Streptomyces sp. NPDC088254]|uniref:DUF202 domain-containing protein n=1 Tax=Streptomyces sp. NPDC088254 TaxID=3365847 RepID=UPI00382941FB
MSGGRDPGLQPERTRLAWRRTTLSSTVAAVLAGRAALHGGVSAAGVVACALCCAAWLGFLLLAHRRISGLTGTGQGERLPGAGPAAGGVRAGRPPEADGPVQTTAVAESPALSPRHAALAALCTVAVAVCGAVLVL